jgi:6,7-dimethyl-8-ribityllumazine synthase
MSTAYHNLSAYDADAMPSAEGMKFGIVVSEWNPKITDALLEGAVQTLRKQDVPDDHIFVEHVPGSFELTQGAHQFIKAGIVDAVIILGCVIKGETPHFDYVCMSTTQGATFLNATTDTPVIFGLITANTMDQAEARSGGILGNKGTECAIAAIKMVDLVGRMNKK